jgi:DNA-binding MarR family transcriptional regulator
MAEQQRAFKGVWIPVEIWLNENLSLQEKAVLAEIDSFCSRYESCYASNEHFAKFIQVGERRIQKILKSLESKGLIEREIIYKNGTKEIEKRFLRVREGWRTKVHEGNEQKFVGGGVQ